MTAVTICFVVAPDTWPRCYTEVPISQDQPRRANWFVPAPAFIVHSKLNGSFEKPQPFVVRGVSRDELLVQKLNDYVEPGFDASYRALYAEGSWHTVGMEYTVEGHRFVRKVRKVVDVLLKISREIQKVQKKAQKAERDFADRGERCGICPVCFGDYVVTKGMVHHGYERPGHGYIVGDCHGVKFPPFEVSCEGTKSWLTVLKQTLGVRQAALASLATCASVLVQTGAKRVGRHYVPEHKTLRRGEDGFEQALANVKWKLEREIERLEGAIVECAAKIAAWAPAAWPRALKQQVAL